MSKGVDIPINSLVETMTNKLWTGNTTDYNGRVYDNEKKAKNQLLGINPEIFDSGIDYKEKLLSDKLDATVFFRVTDTDYEERISIVQIYFSVNLEKLYPTVTTERADEYAVNEATKLIKWSEFRIQNVVRGKPAFDDYFGADQNSDDMQPFYLFRLDTEVSYSYNSCPVDTEQTFNLTTTVSAGGTLEQSPAGTTFNKGETISFYALPDEGSSLDSITINGLPENDNPFCFDMNQNKDVIVNFIASVLTTFIDILTTAPVYNAVDKQWEGLNSNGDAANKVIYKHQLFASIDVQNGQILHTAINHTTSPNFNINCKYEIGVSAYYLVFRGNEYRLRIVDNTANTSRLFLEVWFDGVKSSISTTFRINKLEWYNLGFDINNTTKNINIYATSLEDGTVFSEDFSFINEILDTSAQTIIFSSSTGTTSSGFRGYSSKYIINTDERIVYLTNKNGLSITNTATNDIQDGEMFNVRIDETYKLTDEFGILEPVLYVNGVSIYSDDSEPTNSDLYRLVPYLENGTPATDNEGGYTLVGNFPAGSGLLKGVSNTITFNDSTELVAFAEKYPFFNVLVAYYYDQIRAWDTNAEIVKVEDDDSISQIEFKS
jgi:hypothetical protein